MNKKFNNAKFNHIFLYTFIIVLAVSPLLFWPWTKIPFEIPKVWFLNRSIEVLGVLTLFFFPKTNDSLKKIDTKLLMLVLLFLFTALLSSFWGANFTKSFWGNYYLNAKI